MEKIVFYIDNILPEWQTIVLINTSSRNLDLDKIKTSHSAIFQKYYN
jgi:hypothetical protein